MFGNWCEGTTLQYLGPSSSFLHTPELAISNMIVALILLLLIDAIYAQCGFNAYTDVIALEKGTLITRRRLFTLQIFVSLHRTLLRRCSDFIYWRLHYHCRGDCL